MDPSHRSAALRPRDGRGFSGGPTCPACLRAVDATGQKTIEYSKALIASANDKMAESRETIARNRARVERMLLKAEAASGAGGDGFAVTEASQGP
jgi:hypothetical protein